MERLEKDKARALEAMDLSSVAEAEQQMTQALGGPEAGRGGGEGEGGVGRGQGWRLRVRDGG